MGDEVGGKNREVPERYAQRSSAPLRSSVTGTILSYANVLRIEHILYRNTTMLSVIPAVASFTVTIIGVIAFSVIHQCCSSFYRITSPVCLYAMPIMGSFNQNVLYLYDYTFVQFRSTILTCFVYTSY